MGRNINILLYLAATLTVAACDTKSESRPVPQGVSKSEPAKSSPTVENKSEAIFLPKPISCSGFYSFENKSEQIKFSLTSEEIKTFESKEKYILKDGRILYISATPIADGINNLHVTLGAHSDGDLFVWFGQSVTKTLDGSELSGFVGFESDDFSFHCFSN